MEHAKINAVILNYNTSHMTVEVTLKLVKALAQYDFLIVIVDNGSTPSEYEILKKGVETIDIEERLHRRILIFRSDENLGYSRGNNLGINYAESISEAEYILVMNSDVYVENRFAIMKLLDVLETEGPSCAAIMPMVWNVRGKVRDPRRQIQIRRIESSLDTIIVNSKILKVLFRKRFRKYVYADLMPYKECTIAEVLSGAFMLFRKNVFQEIGLFDEGMFLYHEEIVIAWKLRKAGYYSLFCPKVTVLHLQGGSSGNNERHRFNSKLYSEGIKSQLYYMSNYLTARFITRCCLVLERITEGIVLWLAFDRTYAGLKSLWINLLRIRSSSPKRFEQ